MCFFFFLVDGYIFLVRLLHGPGNKYNWLSLVTRERLRLHWTEDTTHTFTNDEHFFIFFIRLQMVHDDLASVRDVLEQVMSF